MTIVEFMEARLAEDEHDATHSGQLPVPEAAFHQRTLREVAAKRRIVRRYRDAPIEAVTLLLEDVRDLASVYADHADYERAWRPLTDPAEIDLRPGMRARADKRRGSS
jgi:histone H3/H4